jgi:hypothetical protein
MHLATREDQPLHPVVVPAYLTITSHHMLHFQSDQVFSIFPITHCNDLINTSSSKPYNSNTQTAKQKKKKKKNHVHQRLQHSRNGAYQKETLHPSRYAHPHPNNKQNNPKSIPKSKI